MTETNPEITQSAEEAQATAKRTEQLFSQERSNRFKRVDRMFIALMIGQWIFSLIVAASFSPYGWEGKTQAAHMHMWTALLLGAALTLFPLTLVIMRPGWVFTRHVIAFNQMLWSALLIHLSGGRIETHFHVFGSLAFIAFYLDWPLLVTATISVVMDHLIRGILWPESVYGIVNPEWWRFFEHAFWVVFEDIILIWGCVAGVKEMKQQARRQAEIETISEREQRKTAALEMVMAELGPRGQMYPDPAKI